MLALLALVALAGAQEPGTIALERTLEVAPGEAVVELCALSGSVHVWALGAGDLALRIEEPGGALIAEDDDSGGGTTPYVALRVEPGRELVLRALAKDGSQAPVELWIAMAPESEATEEAALLGRRFADEVRASTREGRREEARARLREGLDLVLSTEGAALSDSVLDALWPVGLLASELGDEASARRVWNVVRDQRERTLPPDHADLQEARINVAGAAFVARELELARALVERVIASVRHAFPGGGEDLVEAELLLGAILIELGEITQACAVLEGALAGLERAREPSPRELGLVRSNLGIALRTLGDFGRSRVLLERALEDLRQIVPESHPALANLRANLALTMDDAGDALGASALLARALDDARRALPAGHPELAWLRGNLAAVRRSLGDVRGARELLEETLASCEGDLPQDDPNLLLVRSNLALALLEEGEAERASELLEEVLAARERTLPETNRILLTTRMNLGVSRLNCGDRDSAARLFEEVLAAREQLLPPDHPDVLIARENLIRAELGAGRRERAVALMAENVEGMLRRAEQALVLAPREARQAVASDSKRLGQALLARAQDDPELGERLFALVETQRLVAALSARATALVERDPRLGLLAKRAAVAREALNDLVAGGGRGEADGELAADVARLAAERDTAERALRTALVADGLAAEPLQRERVVALLPAGSAAVGFLRWGPGSAAPGGRTDHLLAHVVRADGALTRIDLGDAVELDPLIAAWRGALGKPVEVRGRAPDDSAARLGDEHASGAKLRERLLDPILACTGEATTLFVCPDDLVYLVPLDALPSGEDRIGDRLHIVSLSSFAALDPIARPGAGEALVLLGGADYAAPPDEADLRLAMSAALAPDSLRGAGSVFGRLPGTEAEIEDVRALFGGATRVLTGPGATKAALVEAVHGARFVHLATHGWFAGEEMRSILDESGAGRGAAGERPDEGISGFAPMTLCGLALAGANRGRDALGRVPGLLTAEELCSLDLSQCELAVLSACETNVGIRRAGQGIQSLQAALHAAGARTAITSLWQVDDAATRRLMERFYTYIWKGALPKADALWRAKQDLRAAGHPVRDWAGWVLSGDLD